MAFDRTAFLRTMGLLRTLTAVEASVAGVVRSHDEWVVYRSNPIRWAVGAPPERIDALCRWLERSHQAISP